MAQKPPACKGSESKKAEKLLTKAEALNKSKKDYKIILEAYESIFLEDPTFAEAYLAFGNTAYRRKDYRSAMTAYDKFIKLCEEVESRFYYRRARSAYNVKEYADAVIFYDDYLNHPDADPELFIEAELNRYRAYNFANPVPFNPKPLKGVSTPDPEYLPMISADGEICFFTRRFNLSSKNTLTPKSVEKFMMAQLVSGTFDSGEVLPSPFNQKESNNEGGAAISVDNKRIYFTLNVDGNFDIYTSTLVDGEWGEIQPLPGELNHPVYWDAQPSISSDGKTLYFASFRDSIYQTGDIYKSELKSDGSWGKPQKLPEVINSTGTEKSPFIHADNSTLYFASDGHQGMGGFDIYMSKLDDEGNWSEPVGLGYPINTESDEVGFFVNTDGTKGYFASNSISGMGGYDIYEFDLNTDFRPEKVLLVTGSLRDENNIVPLNARIEMKNVETRETIELDYDTITGKYASVLLFDNDYIMTVKKKGFGFVSAYFSREDSLSSVRKLDLNLKEIRKGESFILNNILFDFNSSVLNEISKTVVRSFHEFLIENPEIRVALHGHTDNVGSDYENQLLSENRAKEVYQFLLTLGIDQSRLSYKGFGKSVPIADNSTEKGRELNRRTEFVILESGESN